MNTYEASRRRLLKFLLASPAIGPFVDIAAALDAPSGVISDPEWALNVFDFEAAARQTMPPAHLAYLATGVDDDATLRENR